MGNKLIQNNLTSNNFIIKDHQWNSNKTLLFINCSFLHRWLGDPIWGNTGSSVAWIRCSRCSLHGQVSRRAGSCQKSQGGIWDRHQAPTQVESSQHSFVQVSFFNKKMKIVTCTCILTYVMQLDPPTWDIFPLNLVIVK